MQGLYRSALASMKGDVISITQEQAEVLLRQFLETSTIRQWPMLAVAIMCDHIHIVIQVPDNADPEKVLGDIKAYGSRVLNRHWGKPDSGIWWTSRGSKRPKKDDAAIRNAVVYVLTQENPHVIWACDAVKADYGHLIK
jgi:REP element-mobilizing transposase RayT